MSNKSYRINNNGLVIIIEKGTIIFDLIMVIKQIGRGYYTTEELYEKFVKRRKMYFTSVCDIKDVESVMGRIARVLGFTKTKNYKGEKTVWDIDKALKIHGDEIIAI